MSAIDELVAEFCPNGVEWKRLGDVCSRQKGMSITATKMKEIADSSGDVVVFGGGKTKVLACREKLPNGNIIETPSVVVKSRGNIGFEYCEVPFTNKNELWSYSSASTDIDIKYVYYLESNRTYFQEAAKSGKLPQISTGVTDNYEIPVPPYEVQREIVRILDSFTELEAELEARKAQYAYYRDRLLSRESLESLDGKPVEMKRLGDVSDTLTGFPFKSKEFEVSGIKVARGINVKRGSMIFDDDNTVCWKSSDGLEKYILNGGDILIAMDGSLVGKSFGMIAESDLPAILGQRVTRVRCSEIDPRFVFHIIASGTLEAMVDKKKTAGAVPHVSLKDIQAIEIPTPSLATQRKAVDILDRFDALTTSLADGIPAEIEARRQQYEYYRDRLLDLPRKDADAA